MKEKQSKQFVIYSRKSKFTGKGESVENQVEMCRQYIANIYGERMALTAQVYEDEGFSGGNLDRPQFQKMMRDSHESHVDAIVVYRLDRISRNIGDFASLINDLEERGIEFISIREQFDTSSPMGRAMMYIASVFSQLERETIAERIRDNMHELAKTGRWLGGITPTGYESEEVVTFNIDGKPKKAHKLKTIPEEKLLVESIFETFISNHSLTKTDEFLLKNHIVTKNGLSFSRFAIKAILSNPVYMIADENAYDYFTTNEVEIFADKAEFDCKQCIMVYNRTLQKKGKAHKIKPMSEWIVSVGKHEGIISGARWVQVQNLLELNKSKSYRKPRSNTALLSGLLCCANCGAYMRPKLTKRFNAMGEPIYSYICSTKERSRSELCNIKNVNGNTLDIAVVNVIKDLSENGEELAKQLEKSKKLVCSENSGYNEAIADFKNKIAEAEKEVYSLALALAKAENSVTQKYIIERMENTHEHIESLKNRLNDLESSASQNVINDIEFDIIKSMLSSFSNNADEWSVEEKRTAIKTFVRKILWDGDTIHMYLFNADGECEFPLPNKEKINADFAENLVPLGEDSE